MDGIVRAQRPVRLPVVSPVVDHLARVKTQHEADLAAGRAAVALPGALRLKYPNAPREWAWQRVFPATRFYRDEQTGERRRHHRHESVLQRAVKDAAVRLESRGPLRATRFVTRSRRICSKPAMTSERSRNCSATAT
jgi:hypothetical protein